MALEPRYWPDHYDKNLPLIQQKSIQWLGIQTQIVKATLEKQKKDKRIKDFVRAEELEKQCSEMQIAEIEFRRWIDRVQEHNLPFEGMILAKYEVHPKQP